MTKEDSPCKSCDHDYTKEGCCCEKYLKIHDKISNTMTEKENSEEMSDTALLTIFLETDYFEDDRLHGYRCSNCGFSFTSYFIKYHNYCYNCGAININGEAFKKRREKNDNSKV